MATFRYKAVSQSGEVVEGELDGSDKAAVIERLHQQGHTPIRADEVRRGGGRLLGLACAFLLSHSLSLDLRCRDSPPLGLGFRGRQRRLRPA